MRPFELSQVELLEFWKNMARIREVETAIIEEYPKQQIRCPVHLSIGQEAVAVGIYSALLDGDITLSTHRCHAHYVASGGSLVKFFAELYGLSHGTCGGRGGSMHLTSNSSGLRGSIPIVGSGLAIAAGFAYSQRVQKSTSITVAFIGDAVAETGIFHEVCNFVSLHNVPLFIVCENNEYSTYSHISGRQSWGNSVASLASNYNIDSFSMVGNNLLQVHETASRITTEIRKNHRPFLLECSVNREIEHCGPNIDNHLGYRVTKTGGVNSLVDPLTQFRETLLSLGFRGPQIDEVSEIQKQEVAKALNEVRATLVETTR